ncbi:hypothetical protein PV327_009007 [Microctonus hyperodae]|uniref:Uncharacterized protein n=1 Tax=Microctonus hyperodae TaxID=165561 RepID=A0AA39FTA8_MICHY|nr:hypothetical protein PV327_009007 [Microctonus hyperodae]
MPRTRNLLIILVSVMFFLIVFDAKLFSNVYLEYHGETSKNNYELKNKFTTTIQAHRYVTQSLAELGIYGMPPMINKHVLMLTRVPGAGTELLILLLQKLQGFNAFKHIRLPPGDNGLLTSLQQELLIEEITGIIRQEAIPLSFDGSVRFLNFSQFGRQAPVFISMVKNPLDIRISHRKRSTSRIYRGAISHFCGQDPRCTKKNSRWALNRAKENVEKWYHVVGILEHMEDTLDKLENNFPYFFRGAKNEYKKIMMRQHNGTIDNRIHSNQLIMKQLGELFTDEVEFYLWLKSRLLNGTSDNG